jgi:hypothetical protein
MISRSDGDYSHFAPTRRPSHAYRRGPLGRRRRLAAKDEMAVAVECGLNRGGAELRLDVLRVGTVRDQETRVGVAEIVEAHPAETGAPERLWELPMTKVVRIEGRASLANRRQTHCVVWSTTAGGPPRASVACRWPGGNAWTSACRACRARAPGGRRSDAYGNWVGMDVGMLWEHGNRTAFPRGRQWVHLAACFTRSHPCFTHDHGCSAPWAHENAEALETLRRPDVAADSEHRISKLTLQDT